MESLRAASRGLERPPWSIVEGSSPVVAVALHDGHDLGPAVAPLVGIPPQERRREEDPYTGLLTKVVPTRVIAHRSRFEVDLNRPTGDALCLDPEDCWGLEIWKEPPPHSIVDDARYLHAAFYSALEELLVATERRYGRFVMLDIHAYNHRRGGPDAEPDDPVDNPDVNLGTGSLDRDRWGHLVDRFIRDLSSGPSALDVRENVRFKGRYLAAWVHERFAGRGCCLALEFKKTFMDEWTGSMHAERFLELAEALSSTLPGLQEELSR